MTPLGSVHFVASLVAIVAGLVVLRLPKGTRWHRTWGHLYVWAMACTVLTSLFLFNLTGRLTPFHVAAVVGGVTVAMGLWTVLARRPRKEWIRAHAMWMTWSYVGLMAAFTSETLTRFVMPALEPLLDGSAIWRAFWVVVAAASFGTGAAGWWLIRTRLDGAVAATPHAMRTERASLTAPRPASGPDSPPWPG